MTGLGLLERFVALTGRLGFVADLRVQGIADPSLARPLAAEWGVELIGSPGGSSLGFRSGPHGFGQHKRQALRLLYFALALRSALGGAPLRANLDLQNELKDVMLRAAGAGTREPFRDEWTGAPAVRIDSVLALGLRQAGLSLGADADDFVGAWSEIDRALEQALCSAGVRRAA